MSKPMLTTTTPFPSANPYEGGRMMTTANCPVEGCDERVTIDVRDVESMMAGTIVVMHTVSEHWTRVYWGSDPARVQYAGVEEHPADRQDRLASEYGVQETGVAVGHEYHEQVENTAMTLRDIKAYGGKISRIRLLSEAGYRDISYIHATLPDGRIVRVDLANCPRTHLIPANKVKSTFIDWAKEEGVFAKDLGLLDDANYSILY